MADYQDLEHARHYLSLVDDLWQREQALTPGRSDRALTHSFARQLAALMAYEDAIRVAEFKTRPGRFERIHRDYQIGPDQVYQLVDYLKPDAEEVYGLFPAGLVDRMSPLLHRISFKRDGTPRYLEQTPRTNTIFGYATFRFLRTFKRWRPRSWRSRQEQAFQEYYVNQVQRFLDVDYDLALLVAPVGQMVRGYGAVRRRTFDSARFLCDDVLNPLVAREQVAGHLDYRLTQAVGQVARDTMLTDAHGIDLMRTLIQRVLERYDTMPYDQLIADVRKAGTTLRQPIALTVREDAIPPL
jgi:indolepyruvate ferredoxin oxidoreductase beta subunit